MIQEPRDTTSAAVLTERSPAAAMNPHDESGTAGSDATKEDSNQAAVVLTDQVASAEINASSTAGAPQSNRQSLEVAIEQDPPPRIAERVQLRHELPT